MRFFFKAMIPGIVAILAGVLIILLVPFILIFNLINRRLVEKPGYTDLFDRYYQQFDIYNGPEKWAESKQGVPAHAAQIYALHLAHPDLATGGFWQYFNRSAAVAAADMRDGWRAIGMDEVADLVQSAMDKVGKPFPDDLDARRHIIGPVREQMMFEEDEAYKKLAGNPKFIGGAPLYYAHANRFAEQHRQTAA